MNKFWLLLCVLPLLSQAGTVRVISALGAPVIGDIQPARELRVGDRPDGVITLQTPAGATLQLKTDDGATLSLSESSEVRLDAANHTLKLNRGHVALWSEKTVWDVTAGTQPANTMRSQGFLRLRICDAGCQARTGVYGKVDAGEVVVEYKGGRSVLRNRLFLMGTSGGRPELLARDNGVLDGKANFDAATIAKQKLAEDIKSALNDFKDERFDAANTALKKLRSEAPGEPVIVYYLGLIALQQQRNDDALRDLQQYVKEDPEGAREREISKLLTLLTSSELQREVQNAVAQEKGLSAQAPEPDSIAIQTFANQSSPDAAVLAKGVAAMVISDLSKVPKLKVLEREKVQKITDELNLQASGLVGSTSAVRIGRLMRAERVVIGNVALDLRVQIESAVVESVSGATSAVSRSNGNLDTFFTMQKKMVYDTLVGIGISIDTLPPEIRIRLAQFETRNFEAFRAFCVGLNAQDEGRFADAKAAFKRALELDPSFGLAKSKESAMPAADAVNALQLQAVLREAVKTVTQSGKDFVALDLAHANAAYQAGANLVALVTPVSPVDVLQQQNPSNSQFNPPQIGTRMVVGVSYTINPASGGTVAVASTTDWSATQVTIANNQLASVGSASSFVARIGNATQSTDPALTGSAILNDGTRVYWGAWNSTPGSSALVTESGVLKSAPQLGATFSYMFGSSTPVMPATGGVTLLPAGGNFVGATGSIQADFAARQVTLNNLGFTLGSYTFAGLNGQAGYGSTGSGNFSGNYSSGTCAGCTSFSATSSAFTGNFVGSAANGLVFSSIMQTGSGTASGVHLFKQ